MQQTFRHIAFLALSAMILLSGCKEGRHNKAAAVNTTTEVSTPVKPADLVKLHPFWTQVKGRQLSLDEMVARVRWKGHYDGQTQSFNAEMRWQKGQQIWMSFSLLGIEGMRIVITPDSLKVIDRINRRYFLKPFNYLNQKTLLNINFADMENLLLGEMVLANPVASKVMEAAGQVTVLADTNGMVNQARYSSNPLNLLEQRVQYPAVMRNLLATFGAYKPLGSSTFAYERYLRATDGAREFWAEVDFSEVSLNKKMTYPFEINTKYSRVE